jgi:gliding motility-associated-like protein
MDTVEKPVTIHEAPLITASSMAACEYEPVTFEVLSDTTGLSGWNWDMGNGIMFSGTIVSQQFVAGLNHQVIVTCQNAAGCRGADTLTVRVNTVPSTSIISQDHCEGTLSQFSFSSIGATVDSLHWTFGDGSVSNLATPGHQYANPGTYTVQLYAVSDSGCVDTTQTGVTVYPRPLANFNLQNINCINEPVHFFDSSVVSSGTINAWTWDFGDGTQSNLMSPAHQYTNPGQYNISLYVQTDQGCTDTLTKPGFLIIHPQPEADFTVNNNPVIHLPVLFTNQSMNASVYSWMFGDGNKSMQESPQHIYQSAGNYIITLIASNIYNCHDTAMREIIIENGFTIYIPNAFTPDEDGVNDVFSVSGYGIIITELNIWNRWGERIYQGMNGWNGRIQKADEPAKQDVYVYQAIIQDVFGNSHEKKGRVSLIR